MWDRQQLPKILAAVVGNVPPDLCGLMRRLQVNCRTRCDSLEDWLAQSPLRDVTGVV